MDGARHSGNVAVVTGAGSGIGRGVALRLAGEGAVVVALDIDADAARGTVDSLSGSGHLAAAADVAQSAEVDAVFATVRETFGHIDVVVCNAAVNRTPGDGRDQKDERLRRGEHPDHVVDMSDEGWARMIAVNLSGAFYCCRAALRSMNERNRGAIVCVSSIAAQSGTGPVHYTAAKAGLIGLVRSLALEVSSRSIRVNAVCPGSIDTPMMHSVPPELMDGLAARIPLHRIGAPADIASAIAYLASDEASYITGAVLPVNGGLFIG
jgi:3-oxoacyl-[acyl-carrier protein] reductase